MSRRLSVAVLVVALAFGIAGVATGATVYAPDVARCSSGCDHTGVAATSVTRGSPSGANDGQGAGKGAEDDLGDAGHASGWDLDISVADIDETGDASVAAPTLSGLSEPASWAFMIVGVGMVGAGLRLRRGEDPEFG